MERDLLFIADHYLDFVIPKEKAYLNHYFTTDLQQSFLRYKLVFGNTEFFYPHTGWAGEPRNRQLLEKKFRLLEQIREKFKKDMNFEELAELEKGNFPIRQEMGCGSGPVRDRRFPEMS